MPGSRSTQPKRVCFVDPADQMAGVQYSTLAIARELGKHGWLPTVICIRQSKLEESCRQAGIETGCLTPRVLRSISRRTAAGRRVPDPLAWFCNLLVCGAAAAELKLILVKLRPDLVVTKGLAAHFFAAWAARRLGIPVLWHLQDRISPGLFKIHQRILARAARRLPDWIVADGTPIADQLPSAVRPRVSVVANGIETGAYRQVGDAEQVRAEFGIPSDAEVIGSIGRLTPWKGQHHLLGAFARLVADHPGLYLLLIGAPVFDNNAYQCRLQKMVQDAGLLKRVIFTGFRDDLPRLLAAIDVFAYTSVEKDTNPLALIAAMAAGKPIAAFDLDDVAATLGQGAAGRLVPLGDEAALADALAALLQQPALRRSLGAAATSYVMTYLDIRVHTENMLRIFELILGEQPLVSACEGAARIKAAGRSLLPGGWR